MADEVMKRKELIRICQQYDEYCQGCPYVNTHGGCTAGQPWKQAGIRGMSEANRRKSNENA